MNSPIKVEWVGWIKHLASKVWHEIKRSEDFDTVYSAVVTYAKQNSAIVRCHILTTGCDPGNLPSDYVEPFEIRG